MFGSLTENDYLCIQLNKRDMATTRQYFWLAILLFLLPSVAIGRTADSIPSVCPIVKMEAERLPDLNIPRAGHKVLVAGGEYVVFGGHTNGFVPTQTAEYFRDGEWHVMQMTYNHDFGTVILLKSGKVLLAGGVAENIGVGQTYTAELYDPQSHTFDGFGSMNIKRAKASALELDSGKVVVAGNWYHDDGIEQFDGKMSFSYIKDVNQQRSYPIIIRIAKDDALIIGSRSNKDEKIPPIADRLKGDTVRVPLLETWHPFAGIAPLSNENFIGDERKEIYSYLIPVENDNGQVAIVKVENGLFSLLPTACPVPMQSEWGGIWYNKNIIVDRQAHRAYLMGINSDFRTSPDAGYRYYLLTIDYTQTTDGKPATLTLYYTDPLPLIFDTTPTLTSNGDLLMAGGMSLTTYFKPSAMTFLLHVGRQPVAAKSGFSWLLLVVVCLGVPALVCGLCLLFRKRRRPTEQEDREQVADQVLISRICELMENEKLYLNDSLKIADIASALCVNRYYISDCINSVKGCSFAKFVNTYRIEHAKRLLRTQPDMKLSEVWMSSGFSTERTFLRAFKSITGMTPSEYKAQND